METLTVRALTLLGGMLAMVAPRRLSDLYGCAATGIFLASSVNELRTE